MNDRNASGRALREELQDWLRFLRSDLYVFTHHPELLWQQAANQPSRSAVASKSAALLALGSGPARSWFRWVNKPAEASASIFTLIGHQGSLSQVAVSEDGMRAVSSCGETARSGGEIKIWNLATGREEFSRPAGRRPLFGVIPTRGLVASMADESVLAVWEVESGATCCLIDTREPVNAILPLADGRRVVTAGNDLRVWDIQTGGELGHMHGHSEIVHALAAMPDGERVVSASKDHTVRIWDLRAGEIVGTLSGHDSDVWSVAVTADGRRVAGFGGYDHNELIGWDTLTGEAVYRIRVGQSCKFILTPDGRMVYNGGRLMVASAYTGQELGAMNGEGHHIYALSLAPGNRLISAGAFGEVILWDMNSGNELQRMHGHTDSVQDLTVSPDGRVAVTGSSDGTVRVWDLMEIRERDDAWRGHDGAVASVAFTANGERVVSAGEGSHEIKTWHARTGCELASIRGHGYYISALALSPDSRRVVSASLDYTCRIWDLRTGELLKILKGGYGGSFRNIVITQDGRFVAASGSVLNPYLKLWKMSNGRRRLTFWRHREDIDALAATPNSCIAAGSQDGEIRIWDPVSRLLVLKMKGHEGGVTALACSPDGSRIVSGGWDSVVRVWDAHSSGEVMSLTGHTGRIRAVATTPDGRRILSDAEDATIRIWDAKNGAELHSLPSHQHFESVSHGVALLPVTSDGKYVVSDDDRRIVTLWEIESGKPVARFPRTAPADHLTTMDNLVAIGDQFGSVHILELCGVEFGERIITARATSESCAFMCPFCFENCSIPESALGSVTSCTACGKRIRLNPFVVDETPPGKWWWKLWH